MKRATLAICLLVSVFLNVLLMGMAVISAAHAEPQVSSKVCYRYTTRADGVPHAVIFCGKPGILEAEDSLEVGRVLSYTDEQLVYKVRTP